MVDEKRALVALRAGISIVPGAGPQEDPGALQARPCQRQVDLDRYKQSLYVRFVVVLMHMFLCFSQGYVVSITPKRLDNGRFHLIGGLFTFRCCTVFDGLTA